MLTNVTVTINADFLITVEKERPKVFMCMDSTYIHFISSIAYGDNSDL